jgi:hypothetical protein
MSTSIVPDIPPPGNGGILEGRNEPNNADESFTNEIAAIRANFFKDIHDVHLKYNRAPDVCSSCGIIDYYRIFHAGVENDSKLAK